MIDADAELIEHLKQRPELAPLQGRLYAATELPPGTTAEGLPAILLGARGGPGLDFSGCVLTVAYQARVFGATEAQARQAAGWLYDALNERQGRAVRYARLAGAPVLLRAPGARWPYVLAYYTVHFVLAVPTAGAAAAAGRG